MKDIKSKGGISWMHHTTVNIGIEKSPISFWAAYSWIWVSDKVVLCHDLHQCLHAACTQDQTMGEASATATTTVARRAVY